MGFSDQIRKANAKMLRGLDELTVKSTVRVFTNVITEAPVDEGAFKSNFRASVGAPVSGTIDAYFPGEDGSTKGQNEQAAIGAMMKVIPADAGHVVYLSNNLPYAMELERGHSRQAPSGWVRTIMDNAQKMVDEEARKIRNRG